MKRITKVRILEKKLVFVVLTTCMLHMFVFRTRSSTHPEGFNEDIRNSSEQTICIIYDRPPRTGSTSIANTLSSCLRRKGYSQQPLPKMKPGRRRARQVRLILKQRSKRLALVKAHIYISEEDIKLIRTQCHKLMYITSAAPIKERMWSAIKHLLANRHGNTTRESLDMVQARELLRKQSFEKGSLRSLVELNAYPYLTEDSDVAQIKERLIPDYVIRKESLQQDLQALLRAFGCGQSFKTRNVHEDSVRSVDELFYGLHIVDNDQLYKSLCQVAELNNAGTLEMVKDFIQNNKTKKQITAPFQHRWENSESAASQ